MGTTFEKTILAVVSSNREQVAGGAPLFYEKDRKQVQETAFLLEKILDGMAHELNDHTMIIVRHGS
ncbi:hypothetical protein C8P63_11032 [Melghirimyces profundicolus]|uniref:Uncharacterized protein n=1 Tax=Melghirimyces profundicolus TaxID=1242148 RepID=A0A2T6BUY3_9BACL|nr:hypothetical protein [Melghirimyces profundicolus]PTX59888.1 hypothetical protein C8P63_11032 [Melghirimyces profundicolus]